MAPLNVLIIGAGKISRRHAAAWKKLTSGRIHITDTVESRSRQLAEEFEIEACVDPLESITSLEIDIVDVCVPTPFHSQYVLAALAEGCHVFVEKPLCLSTAEATKIVAAAQEADRHVQVGYLFRHHPTYQQVQQWLREGLLGEPHMALVRMGGRGSAAAWKHRRADGGG
ncbi:MAG: Gfo/Idh/MocA family oxidoreductase, partial [Gemmatimonadetes bacterium]|nr:Gfo/Idh/MocA family oxidoreductase [Gemmatimonadota bacterium]